MGWNNGTELYQRLIGTLIDVVPDFEKRKAIHKKMINAFEDCDWDCVDEVVGMDFACDVAIEELRALRETGEVKDDFYSLQKMLNGKWEVDLHNHAKPQGYGELTLNGCKLFSFSLTPVCDES